MATRNRNFLQNSKSFCYDRNTILLTPAKWYTYPSFNSRTLDSKSSNQGANPCGYAIMAACCARPAACLFQKTDKSAQNLKWVGKCAKTHQKSLEKLPIIKYKPADLLVIKSKVLCTNGLLWNTEVNTFSIE